MIENPAHGSQVTIIDYTLSRITIKKHTLFNDLGKDPDLFIAEGDFQFEVYRMMRNAVKYVSLNAHSKCLLHVVRARK